MQLKSSNLQEYEFGPFCLRPEDRLLLREGEPVKLPPKAYDTLLFLVQRSGSLVEKGELMDVVWPDIAVEEGNLNLAVSQIRKALQDQVSKPQYIETVPKFGYRFIADVEVNEYSLDKKTSPNQTAENTIDAPDQIQEQPITEPQSPVSKPKRPHRLLWVAILIVGAVGVQFLFFYRPSQQNPQFAKATYAQIDYIENVSPPLAGQQFYIRIQGRRIDPDSVRIIVTGRGCQDFGSCVVPNNVLHWYGSVTDSHIEKVPLTLAPGDFLVFIQNGTQGEPSNPTPLSVKVTVSE